MTKTTKPKLLIFIVAYHAETTIKKVISRIPVADLRGDYELEILIIDDASGDKTFEAALSGMNDQDSGAPITVLHNPVNQGYGGNQQIGFYYACEKTFDYVALIHGDGQYAPEVLPALLKPFQSDDIGAVFGSRMMVNGDALRGGMPLYKFVGNKILSKTQNLLLGSTLSEFHSGYRIYSTKALKKIPFSKNTKDFHFDTEIIIQLLFAKLKIVELPIPTYYGDEICRVNGVKYAKDVVLTSLRAAISKKGIFYDPKWDTELSKTNRINYVSKFGYISTHSLAFNQIRSNSNVLDIGCAGGYVSDELKRRKNCKVTGIDFSNPSPSNLMDQFFLSDVENFLEYGTVQYDYYLFLDIIEHLKNPERFLENFYNQISNNADAEIIFTTGNVAFFVTRIMLMLGHFNYGEKGILDKTHTRLFTFSSFRRLLSQSGFYEVEVKGVPAPFPIVIKSRILAKLLLLINQFLIRISPGLFSYQIYILAKPNIELKYLLGMAHTAAKIRAENVN